MKGEYNPQAKLTEDTIREIFTKNKNGISLKTLADIYGVDKVHLSNIKRGIRWGHLNLKLNDLSVEELFFDRIAFIPYHSCWEWIGYRTVFGHGQLREKGKLYLAHRLSYEIHKGEIPEGMVVMHTCDNPSCVNPDHLVIGTNSDNIKDMHNKGRHKPSLGVNNGTSKLTESDVLEIRQILKTGNYKSYREIGERYGVTQTVISNINNNKSWTHV